MSQMERIQNNLGVRRTRGAPPAGCGRGRKGHAERSSPYGPGCRERSLRSWGQAQGPLCGSVPGFGTAPGSLRCGQRRAAGKQPGRSGFARPPAVSDGGPRMGQRRPAGIGAMRFGTDGTKKTFRQGGPGQAG